MASATSAMRQPAEPRQCSRVDPSRTYSTPACMNSWPISFATTPGWATSSHKITGSTEHDAEEWNLARDHDRKREIVHAAEDHPPDRIPLRCAGALSAAAVAAASGQRIDADRSILGAEHRGRARGGPLR